MAGDTMMLPTHVLAGLLLAVPVAWVFPEFESALFLGAIAGSVFPDLDMYAGHRRTLHYPVYYPVVALGVIVLAAVVTTPATVGLAAFLAAAALHCRMDELGGSLELRPWEHTSERAVYDHYNGTWRAPRRWVRYDGSPRDLLASLVVGLPLLVVLEGWPRWLVAALLVVATVYALLRKRLADVAELLVGFLPRTLREYVPFRYREN